MNNKVFSYSIVPYIKGVTDKIIVQGSNFEILSTQQGLKPIFSKLYIMISACNDEYCLICFRNGEILEIFNRFYGAHPETKTDFIIRIDAENKKYELALYRQGLKEPVVIPESAYQLIVFKNKFEDYRSENYNQPRGAWIW